MSVRVRPGPFSFPLLRWYEKARRKLPWRETRDPYRILLSEVMLQQTQVQTVIPYYHRFLKAFPSFGALAKAPLGRVLKLWEGLGYYSRARNLHALARHVMRHHQGRLPSTPAELLELPGIGRYTAGAVLSIAFDQDFPVVDGNVQRVLARYYAIRRNIAAPEVHRALWDIAAALLVKGRASDFNQALMELGATVCTPQNPDCLKCPVRKNCRARLQNLQDQLPVKTKKAAVPHVQIGAGIIWRGDQILISQRPLDGLLGGLWEFPGGKLEPGERMKDCVRREIKEELGIDVRVGKELAAVDHAYSHFKITLHAHSCRYVRGTPQKLGVRDWRWIFPKDLRKFAFPAANQPVIKKILEAAAPTGSGRGRNAPEDRS